MCKVWELQLLDHLEEGERHFSFTLLKKQCTGVLKEDNSNENI